ncbi:unnamed protein product [Hapterophycus canaliculatus]
MAHSLPKLQLEETADAPHGIGDASFDDGMAVNTDAAIDTPDDDDDVQLRLFSDGSKAQRTQPLGRRADGSKRGEAAKNRLLSATSAALTRVKGMTIRSGSSGKVLNPRTVTLVPNMFSPSRRRKSGGGGGDDGRGGGSNVDGNARRALKMRNVENKQGSPEQSCSSRFEQNDVIGDDSGNASNNQKLSIIFDDGKSAAETTIDAEGSASARHSDNSQEHAATPRSKWASTLMASTLAREKTSGKNTTPGRLDLLPGPRDAENKVEYLAMVCKAVQNYASTQSPRLSRVRDGQHMINQLRDVSSDLRRQTEKILAVYDTTEVRKSADRLGETLVGVYDLLGDVEGTAVMFGKKKGFGKRVSSLVHDIGTRANALLAATSLAIADRPNVLYMADTGGGEPPAPQQEELLKMCIEGDKVFLRV